MCPTVAGQSASRAPGADVSGRALGLVGAEFGLFCCFGPRVWAFVGFGIWLVFLGSGVGVSVVLFWLAGALVGPWYFWNGRLSSVSISRRGGSWRQYSARRWA